MTDNNIKLTFPSIFEETVRKFGDHNSYAFVGEKPRTYLESAREIRALMAFLEKSGIRPVDKVALLSNNMPNWSSVYFSITFMGAVVVPVLPDFSANEVGNVLMHSGARALFISSSQLSKIADFQSDQLELIIQADDYSVISPSEIQLRFDPSAEPAGRYDVNEDDLASIIYTSGTTGRSKGVMLTHRNICFNAMKGKVIQPVDENDRFLSVLPLSHTYENTLGLLLPLLVSPGVQ